MRKYDSYKDSGVKWMGEIPAHWETTPFSHFFQIRKDIAGKEGYDVLSVTQTGIKVKDVEHNEGQIASDYSKYQFADPGDFIMNHMDLITGYIGRAESHGVTSPDYRVFRAFNENAYEDYYLLVFQLCYKWRVFFGLGQGVANKGRWRLPANQLKKFQIPVPPYLEQKAIASFLNKKTADIDEQISKVEREIGLLKEYKQAVIARVVTHGLNPDAPTKPSGISWIGDIPMHWHFLRNKNLFIPHYEAVGTRNDIPLLSLTTEGVILRDVESGKGKFPKDFEKYNVVYPNCIIFCLFDIDETPRTVGLCHNYGMITNAYSSFKIADSVLPRFVNYYYTVVDNIKGLRPYYTGLRKVVQGNKFMQLKVPIPPIEEQEEIVDYIDRKTTEIDRLVVELTYQVEYLKEYKQRLIADVVTGKINVQPD